MLKTGSVLNRYDPRFSLRVQLGLVFGSLTVALAAVLSITVSRESRNRIEDNIGGSVEQMAAQLTDDLDRGTYDFYVALQGLALHQTQSDGTEADTRQFLFNYQQLYPEMVWISLVDPSGKVIVCTNPAYEGRDVSQTAWFGARENGVSVVPIQPSDLPEPMPPGDVWQIPLVAIAPARNADQQVNGLFAAAISDVYIADRVRELVEDAPFDGIQVFVLSSSGVVLASSDANGVGESWRNRASFRAAQTGSSGYVVESAEDGNDYLAGYATTNGFRDYAGADWRVIVTKEADIAFAPAADLSRRLLWSGVIIGLGVIVLGWLLGGHITRPLSQLTAAADAIHTGQETLHLPKVTGRDEVGRLGQSMHALVNRLTEVINERSAVETQFRVMFELALDVILVADGINGTILEVNPAVRRILGYEPDALTNQPFTSLFPPNTYTRNELLERLRAYGAVIEEQEFRRQDGTTLLMDLTATMIPFRNGQGVLITLRDISERQQLMLAQLESESMRSELQAKEQALDLKSLFVSIASHDLRNPLATILLSSDIIRNYGDRIPEEKRIGHFLRIETSIKYMQKLLDDLNLMEKLERGLYVPTPESIDLNEFCQTLMDEARAATETASVFRFTLDAACQFVSQDPRLMRQAISNLLSNALKYSRPDQPIDFSIKCVTDMIQVTVRDYGIGIPAEDQKDLFKTFHRARNTTSIPGTGIGLAITRRAVESLKGRLEFVSIEGEGTTFIAHIPLVSTSTTGVSPIP